MKSNLRVLRNDETNEVYLHQDDVAALLRQIGESEPADTRTRLEVAALNLRQLGKSIPINEASRLWSTL